MSDATDPRDDQASPEKLLAEIDHLRWLLESSPQVPWSADAEGNVTDFSPRWLELTGLTREEALDGGWVKAPHPDDVPAMAEAWTRALQTGERYDVRHRLRLADGSYRWMHTWAVPRQGAGDEILAWYGSTEDVHEVSAQSEWLAAAADALPAIVFHVDTDLVYRFVNHHVEETFARPKSAILGRTIREIVGEETFDAVLPYLERALAGERAEWAMWVDFPSGRRFTRATYVPSRGSGGEVVGIDALAADETEARLAQEALQDARARTDAILASADVATWVLDVQNDRVYADRNLARMFGADEAMADGGPAGEYVARMHPDDRGRVADALRKAMTEGVPYDVEYRIVLGEEERWVTARGLPERDKAGTIVRLPGVVVDVTALKRSQERERVAAAALRESAERFRLLVESVPEIAWTARPDGYLDYYNERWYEFTGRERGGGGDESWTPLLHPDDLKATYAAWRRSVETGEPYEVELRLKEAATGEFRWFIARARAMRSGDGTIFRWFGVTSDVDEQKRAQHTLAFLVDLEDALRPLEEPERIVGTVARMLGEYLGADRCAYAEVEDDEDHFVIHGDYTRGDTASIVGRYAMAAFGRSALALHRAGETFVVGDVDRDVPDVHDREVYRLTQIQSVVSVPLLKSGRFVAGMGIHQRTSREWTAEELELIRMVAERCWAHIEQARVTRAMNESLERQVRERTADLQASNDALRSFTYHVSHDLRAPLRGIASTSRIVQEDYGDTLPEEACLLLDRQAEAATKLGRLIDDLLRLSRLSQKELAKGPLDLTAMAREAAQEALSVHPSTTVNVVVEESLAARADASLLQLALGNLVENAVKYSPQGGTVRVGQRENGAFFVSDEGIGIDPRYFGKIFEPFQRLHLDSEFAGTGIGLSNVRQVVERHGGRVWVESQPGQGSTFLFTLGN